MRFMHYIVLDLEWNEPSHKRAMNKKPPLLQGEINQMSAVKHDENYHILDNFKIMVTPHYDCI